MDETESPVAAEIAALEQTVLRTMEASAALQEVATVWDRLGLTDSVRQTRRLALANNIGDLLNEIVQGEQKLERSMISSLEGNLKELSDLCQQLSLPPEQFSEKLSLYEKEKSARQRVDALNKIKFEREKRLKRIMEMEISLCKELGDRCEISASKTHLPSEEELREYLQRVEKLEQILAQRRKRRLGLVSKVKEVSVALELEPGDDYTVLMEGEFVYSTEQMEKMEAAYLKFEDHIRNLERTANELREAIKTLWERLDIPDTERQEVQEEAHSFRHKDIALLKAELERLTELKKEHMESFLKKTREELQEIWEECLYGEQQRREFAAAFVQGPFDDDLLSQHESEVDRMRGFYQDNANIYEQVKKREAMFSQLCELERKDNDPSRFSNRGGQLLKDQAMKKQLTKELPRVEKALKEVLKNWEDDHERFFIMHDTRYLDTIEQQWKEKEANKSQEKVKRQKEKEAATLLEMTYGSKPSTPKHKRPAASPLPPATVPTKMRRVDMSPCMRPTAASGSRLPRGKTSVSRSTAKTASKTPLRPDAQRKLRDRRKILADRNVPTPTDMRDSSCPDDTVGNCQNLSLASTLSYTDFQHGILAPSGDQKRSTVLPKNSSSIESSTE